jgi:hypothetical protein
MLLGRLNYERRRWVAHIARRAINMHEFLIGNIKGIEQMEELCSD